MISFFAVTGRAAVSGVLDILIRRKFKDVDIEKLQVS